MPTDPQNDRYPMDVPRGGGPYDDDLNTNLNKLAVDVPNSGPIADRPDPGVWAPQRWYATDKDVEYYNTGSSWQSLGTDPTTQIIPIAAGLTPGDAIHPSSSSTPINDAINTVYETGNAGYVLLPPQTITQSDSVRPRPNVSLFGAGRIPAIGPREATLVSITDPTAHLIYFDSAVNETYRGIEIDGFQIEGETIVDGNGLQFGDPAKTKAENQQAYGFHLGKLDIRRFDGSLIRCEQGGAPWACNIEYINAYGFDPGASANRAVLDFRNAMSVATHIGMIDAYPNASRSGQRADFVHVSASGDLRIDFLNIGGTLNKVLTQDDDGASIDIAGVNYEITGQLSAARDTLYELGDNSNVRIGQTRFHADVSVNSIYKLIAGGQSGAPGARNKTLGPVVPTGQITLPSTIVDVAVDTSGTVVYHGLSSDVTNNTGGTLSPGVAALGDLTMVT